MMKRFIAIIAAVAMSTAAFARVDVNDELNKPHKFSVGINVFEVGNFLTPNIEAGVALSQCVSLHLGGRYNKWTFNPNDEQKTIQNRKRTGWLGVRYWPWNTFSGWYIQAKAQYNEINSNIFTDKYTDPVTQVTTRKKIEGDAVGGGIGFGYDVMIAKHVNLEFGLSCWAGTWIDYNTYAKAVGGMVIPNECYRNKFFFLPDDVHITFQFTF